MPPYSQTLRRANKIQVQRDESKPGAVPEISVRVVRGVSSRKRPMKGIGSKLFIPSRFITFDVTECGLFFAKQNNNSLLNMSAY